MPQALPLILTGATTLFSTFAEMSAISSQNDLLKQEKQIHEANRIREIQAAQISAQEQDFDAAQQIGSAVANLSASGINLGSGSSLLSIVSLKRKAALDRFNIRHMGDLRAADQANAANAKQFEIQLNRRRRASTLIGGALKLGGQIAGNLSGISGGSGAKIGSVKVK